MIQKIGKYIPDKNVFRVDQDEYPLLFKPKMPEIVYYIISIKNGKDIISYRPFQGEGEFKVIGDDLSVSCTVDGMPMSWEYKIPYKKKSPKKFLWDLYISASTDIMILGSLDQELIHKRLLILRDVIFQVYYNFNNQKKLTNG